VTTEVRVKAVGMIPERAAGSLGLREHVLSPLETLAQSISTIAPSTTPLLTIPLVFALAGTATWLAYLLALTCMALIAFCIAIFARDSASPGSLYAYTRATLPPVFGFVSAWALLFAYITTATSMIGGILNYSYASLGTLGRHMPPALFACGMTACVVWVAYRDIKVSAQCMLWIEGVTICLVTTVLGTILWKHGLRLDAAQFQLDRSSLPGVRLGVILAVFSFVGFESATALGAEAREPLKTIPRSVVQSALLAGFFFVACSYTEVLGFAGTGQNLGTNAAPLRLLSSSVGFGILGPIIDAGVLVSMFACMLACVIASARILLLMAHHGLVHRHLSKTHAGHETPWIASIVAGVLVLLPTVVLVERGVAGADIYGWMGSLAVYGFLTAYGFVAVALPIHLRRRGRLSAGSLLLAVAAGAATLLAMLGSLFPVPPAPLRYLPYLYVLYLIAGVVWYALAGRHKIIAA
jgi:amino acid transporter